MLFITDVPKITCLAKFCCKHYFTKQLFMSSSAREKLSLKLSDLKYILKIFSAASELKKKQQRNLAETQKVVRRQRRRKLGGKWRYSFNGSLDISPSDYLAHSSHIHFKGWVEKNSFSLYFAFTNTERHDEIISFMHTNVYKPAYV